jgi:hypothetical protein
MKETKIYNNLKLISALNTLGRLVTIPLRGFREFKIAAQVGNRAWLCPCFPHVIFVDLIWGK